MQQNAVKTVDLIDRAQRYCATAEHCPADVEQLLKRLFATREQIDEVIGVLKEQKYIDEARYCKAYVHDQVMFHEWGKLKIQAVLRTKRLPDTAIQEALDTIDEDTYASNIRKLIHARRNDDKQKLMRFMLQRGYTFYDMRRYANMDADEQE